MLAADTGQRAGAGDEMDDGQLGRHHLRQPVRGPLQRHQAPGQGLLVQPFLVVQPGRRAQHDPFEDRPGVGLEVLAQRRQLLARLAGAAAAAQPHDQMEPGEGHRPVSRPAPFGEHLAQDLLALGAAPQFGEHGRVPGAQDRHLGLGAQLPRVADRGPEVLGRQGVLAPPFVGLPAGGERFGGAPVVTDPAEDAQALVGVRACLARPFGPVGQHIGTHLEGLGELPFVAVLPAGADRFVQQPRQVGGLAGEHDREEPERCRNPAGLRLAGPVGARDDPQPGHALLVGPDVLGVVGADQLDQGHLAPRLPEQFGPHRRRRVGAAFVDGGRRFDGRGPDGRGEGVGAQRGGRLGPVQGVGAQFAHLPVPAQREHHAEHLLLVAGGDGVTQGGADVLVLALQERDGGPLSGAAQFGFDGTDQLPVEHQVAPDHGFPLRRLVEPGGGVLADGLQQPVAHLAVLAGRGDDERLVDQGAEQTGDLAGAPRPVRADRLGGGEGAAAREDGEPAQHGAFGLVQEVPGPVDDGAQGLLTGQYGAGSAGEQAEPVVEPVGDLARGEHPQPGGGEFDGERQSVQAAADLRRGRRGLLVRVGPEARPGGGAAVGEQAQRHRVRQRFDRADELARDAEGFTAGGEHGEVRAVGEQVVGEGRGRVDDVFAVVQEQQHATPGTVLGEPCQGVFHIPLGDPELLGANAAQHGLAGAERGQYGLRHRLGVVDRGEFGQPDTVRPGVRDGFGGLLGEPGLARTAGAQEGDQPGVREVLAQGRDVVLAPDETGEPGPEVAVRCGGGRGGRGAGTR